MYYGNGYLNTADQFFHYKRSHSRHLACGGQYFWTYFTGNILAKSVHGASSWFICFALLPADFGGEYIVFG